MLRLAYKLQEHSFPFAMFAIDRPFCRRIFFVVAVTDLCARLICCSRAQFVVLFKVSYDLPLRTGSRWLCI